MKLLRVIVINHFGQTKLHINIKKIKFFFLIYDN